MKIHKGQMLIPKTKSGHQTVKWVRNGKNCTPTSTSQSVTRFDDNVVIISDGYKGEQVELLTTTCGKTDVLLSKAQLVTSIQQPIVWSEEGILRQALLSPEKSIKCEKTAEEEVEEVEVTDVPSVNTSLVAINITPQQPLFTPVGRSQVLMISDLGPSEMILPDEPISLPAVTWQSTEKKNTESSCVSTCSVPIITSQSLGEQDSDLLVEDENTTFSTLSSISVLNQSVIPTMLSKERKNPLKGNPLINAGFNITLHNNNKTKNIKNVSKTNKTRRKMNSEKQILLKPTSSLLSSIALNYSLDESKESVLNVVSSTGNVLGNNELLKVSDFTADPSQARVIVSDVTLSSTNQHPMSSSSVIMSSESSDNNFNSSFSSEEHRDEVTLSDLSIEKNDYSECLNTDQHMDSETNDHMLYHSNDSDNLLHHPVSRNSPILTTPPSTQNHVRIINLNTTTPLIQDSMLIHSGTRMSSGNQTSILHPRLLSQSQDLIHHSDQPTDLMNGNEFHRESAQIILSSSMDHHSVQTGHSEPGYTERLLSQLSNEGTLPTMSSSQVSSVLSALVSEPNNKSQHMNGLENIQNSEPHKASVKSELDSNEYRKSENLGRKNKTKPDEDKWKLYELNKHICYRCTSCMYLSLKKAIVIAHYDKEHNIEVSELIGKQLAKKPMQCIGCDNIFYSKHSVQVHLLQDHNVSLDELSEIRNVVFIANKLVCSNSNNENPLPSPYTQCRSPAPRSRNHVSSPTITVNKSIQPQTNILPSSVTPSVLTVSSSLIQSEAIPITTPLQTLTTTAILQPLTRTVPVLLETTTSTGIKPSLKSCLDSTEQLPTTPSFSLFSDIHILKEKKESFDSHENSKEKVEEHDIAKKRGRPKGNHVLKISSKKVKLSEIKTETKESNPFRCGIGGCVVRILTEANLDYHRQCHSGASPGTFSCPNCSHTTCQWNSMTIHLWKEHQIDMDLFSCDQCTYKTNSYSKLMNQHCKIHGDERPFLCDHCGKGFKTTKQLRNHKVIHRARVKATDDGVETNGPLRRHYPCKLCNRSFADGRILRHHIENVHNKLRRFLCSFCGHAASSRSSLRMHIRQHTGEKPFSCDECEYTTSDHNSLRRHKMRHSGTFPYRCPHCTYACIQSTTYKTHLKNKHPGMNEGFMFDCPECPFRTVKKDNFLTHTAEHALGGDPRARRKKHTLQNVIKVNENLSEDSIVIVNLHSHTNEDSA